MSGSLEPVDPAELRQMLVKHLSRGELEDASLDLDA